MGIYRQIAWRCAITGLAVGASISCATEESAKPDDTVASRMGLNSTPKIVDFALYAQNSTALRDRVKVMGADVGVQNVSTGPTLVTGYELGLSTDVTLDAAHDTMANRVQLLARARVGDVEAKTLNNQGGSYAHLYAFPAMPALPSVASVTPGSTNITAAAGVTTPLTAGSYAAVAVKNTGTLRLNGGVYQVASVQLENDAKIEALAPVQLRISGRLSLLDRARITAAAGVTLTAGDLRVEVSGRNGASGSLTDSPKAVILGNADVLNALVLAPNGTVQMGQRTTWVGAVAARDVYVDNDSVVTFQSGLGPIACSPPNCDDGNPCTADSCNNGTCAHTAVAAGTSCSDGNACNGAETCNVSGVCVAGTAPVVDDGNPCTTDSCAPASGVQHTPVAGGTSCSDGNPCNGVEACNATGVCVAGTPVTCTPLDQCHTAGTCDPATGACSNPAIPGCTLSCPTGTADCDLDSSNGCETNLTNNPAHCGSCNTVCPSSGGGAICQNQVCVSTHLATAVNQQSVSYPGGTTPVPANATVQFTVITPPTLGTGPADVHYYLSRNLVFQSATAGTDPGPVCQSAVFNSPLPNGVQGNAQSLDCQWSGGTTPLVITALASGTLAPRDDPYAAVACFAPYNNCVPVRIALQLPAGTVPAVGVQRTAIILASADDAPAHPYTKDNLASTFFSASNPGSARSFYAQSSYGPASASYMLVTGAGGTEGTIADVYGPYPVTSNGCMDAAQAIAAAGTDIDFTNYERLVIAANDPTHCGGGGLTGIMTVTAQGQPKTITASIVYNTSVGDTTLNGRIGSVVLHEYGHQLGLDHGGGWDCGPAVLAYDGTCNDLNYGDYTDLMGNARYADFGPVNKRTLGWLEGGRVYPVWQSGRYVISAYEDTTENVKVLQLPRKLRAAGVNDAIGIASGSYFLALHQPVAPWTDWLQFAPTYANNITIHMDEGAINSTTALLDLTPNSQADYSDLFDGALTVGQTFSDPVSGVSVTLVSVAGSTATVDVTITQRTTRFVGAGASDPYSNSVANTLVTGSGNYNPGDTATLTAVAPAGFGFRYWLDAAGHWMSASNPYSMVVSEDTWLWAVFQAVAPDNDNFASAQPITSLPTTVREYTQSARNEPGEPTDIPCGDIVSQPNETVWFSFTPTATQNLSINTSSSTYFTRIAVFTGTALNALTLVPGACSYDDPHHLASVTFTATAGTTYYIQIGAAGGAQDLVANFAAAP